MKGVRVLSIKSTWLNWKEILRAFSWPASLISLALAAVLAADTTEINWLLLSAMALGVILMHTGANIVNEYYDVSFGIDSLEDERASSVLLENRLKPETALTAALIMIGIFLCGIVLFTWLFELPLLPVFGLLAALGGYFYTAPPLKLKYRSLGPLVIFVLFGPLLALAGYYALTGEITLLPVWLSLPPGILVSALLQANDLRDYSPERSLTPADRFGLKRAAYIYIGMLILPYLLVLYFIMIGLTSYFTLAVFLALPLKIKFILRTLQGLKRKNSIINQDNCLTDEKDNLPPPEFIGLDEDTGKLHLIFGLLWLFTLAV